MKRSDQRAMKRSDQRLFEELVHYAAGHPCACATFERHGLELPCITCRAREKQDRLDDALIALCRKHGNTAAIASLQRRRSERNQRIAKERERRRS